MNTLRAHQPSVSGFPGIFSSMARMAVRNRAYRQTVRDLEKLSDRELMDIGLNRGDIRRIAGDAARRA